MTRGADQPPEALLQLTPAEVVAQLGTSDTEALTNALKSVGAANQAITVAEVTGPGEMDSYEREMSVLRGFMHYVGRPPTLAERDGPPDPSCDVCIREAQSCAEHRRKPGEAIQAPPHPWPSERPGRYPGTYRIENQAPYNIYNSVR